MYTRLLFLGFLVAIHFLQAQESLKETGTVVTDQKQTVTGKEEVKPAPPAEKPVVDQVTTETPKKAEEPKPEAKPEAQVLPPAPEEITTGTPVLPPAEAEKVPEEPKPAPEPEPKKEEPKKEEEKPVIPEKKPEEKPKEPLTPEEQEDLGITTGKEDYRGNWYYKRQYLKDAGAVYKEIRRVVDQLDSAKKDVMAKRAAIDRELSDFYFSLGFAHGELEESLTSSIEQLQKERGAEGQLSEKERSVLKELTDKKKALETLHTDVMLLRDLDGKLDQAYKTLLEQIERARAVEQKSWEQHNAIAEAINDKKAQQILIDMKAGLELVKSIDQYLHATIARYVDEISAQIHEKMGVIKKSLDTLKAQGIILQKKVKEEVEAEEKLKKEVVKKEPVKKPVKIERGIFERTWDSISGAMETIWEWIKAPFSYIYRMIAGEPVKKKEEKVVA